MLEKIRSFFVKDNLLDQAYRDCYQALDDCRVMCEKSIHALRKTESTELEFDIYKMDKQVNRFEQQVRRRVLTHIVVSGTGNLTSGLILLNIIVDLERIGDYTKNIVDMARNYAERLNAENIENALQQIEERLVASFSLLQDALENSNTEVAREILIGHHKWNKQCDRWVVEIISGEMGIPDGKQCAALALYLRYLKRILSHQKNIASSVVNPFDKIRYKAEEEDKESENA